MALSGTAKAAIVGAAAVVIGGGLLLLRGRGSSAVSTVLISAPGASTVGSPFMVKVTVLDSSGRPIPGINVMLNIRPPSSSTAATGQNADANGVAIFNVVLTYMGLWTFSATAGGKTSSAIAVQATPPPTLPPAPPPAQVAPLQPTALITANSNGSVTLKALNFSPNTSYYTYLVDAGSLGASINASLKTQTWVGTYDSGATGDFTLTIPPNTLVPTGDMVYAVVIQGRIPNGGPVAATSAQIPYTNPSMPYAPPSTSIAPTLAFVENSDGSVTVTGAGYYPNTKYTLWTRDVSPGVIQDGNDTLDYPTTDASGNLYDLVTGRKWYPDYPSLNYGTGTLVQVQVTGPGITGTLTSNTISWV